MLFFFQVLVYLFTQYHLNMRYTIKYDIQSHCSVTINNSLIYQCRTKNISRGRDYLIYFRNKSFSVILPQILSKSSINFYLFVNYFVLFCKSLSLFTTVRDIDLNTCHCLQVFYLNYFSRLLIYIILFPITLRCIFQSCLFTQSSLENGIQG